MNHPVTRATGIVLAGGRSLRFGRDKLVERVKGAPLFHHAVRALGEVCDEVIVAGAPGAAPPLPASLRVPVHVARDAVAHRGPLAGLLSAFAFARAPVAVVAGGDMYALAPALLGEMLRRAAAGPSDAVALSQSGITRSLPCTLRIAAARPVAERRLREGDASIRGLLQALRTEVLAEKEWRAFDPEGASLYDVDLPEDLPGP